MIINPEVQPLFKKVLAGEAPSPQEERILNANCFRLFIRSPWSRPDIRTSRRPHGVSRS